jgi:FtsP/CotA-like multicopper oxidase with cupredoxin domain
MPRQWISAHTQLLIKVGALAAGCALANPASAQSANRRIADPPVLQGTLPSALKAFTTPGSRLQPRDRVLDLKVTYTDSQLYNPSSGLLDKVRLRSYQGKGVDPTAPYVSPTIEVMPGETVRMTLDNALPADPSCLGSEHASNAPHCFNGTNLHTHGLWVNPAGNGDNVLLSINPGVQFTYEYNIPSDHPAGTFWYHTHRHGSTALQVSSGMAGALIIRGNRFPSDIDNGDIDTLLPRSTVPERVLVMQQIQYACRGPSPGPGKLGPIKQDKDGRYICDPNDVGGIEDYDQFGPGTWPASGRYTSLNGEIIPRFPAIQGRLERWRVIHAGVRDTISLQFFKVRPGKLKDGQLVRGGQHTQQRRCARL